MSLDNHSILVVDDEAPIRSALCRIAKRLGCVPVEAASGSEAIAILDQGSVPNAAIFDFNMPGMTGLDLAKNIHHRLPSMPILLISGGTPNPDIQEGVDSGVLWAYSPKPWNLDWMKEAISAMIRKDPPPAPI